jgi:hypothetical protein
MRPDKPGRPRAQKLRLSIAKGYCARKGRAIRDNPRSTGGLDGRKAAFGPRGKAEENARNLPITESAGVAQAASLGLEICSEINMM